MRNLSIYFLLCLLFPLPGQAKQRDLHVRQGSYLFVENKGQVTDQYHHPRTDIDFRIKVPGISIFVGKGAIHYQWSDVSTEKNAAGNEQLYTAFQRLDVTLAGANPHAELIKTGQQAYYENYYLPQCPGGTRANAFSKVIYRNIYPNIDWIIYTSQVHGHTTLKYDFLVREGGNAKDIRLVYSGADSLRLHNGAFTAYTRAGTVTEHAPYTYDAATREPLTSAFTINSNTVGFDIGEYAGNIVIDPAINWGSYFGGEGNDMCNEIKTDKWGNVYVVGNTASDMNIATINAHQVQRFNFFRDAYILKLDADGSIAWATYFGGNQDDELLSEVIDASGNIYVGGVTRSMGMAVGSVHQTNLGGYKDGLLAKFNASGDLLWSTYYGGTGYDSIVSMAISGTDLYIGGRTSSMTGIATMGDPLSDNEDAFLAKFDASGGSRQWGIYHLGYHIAEIVCHSGFVYIAGVCYSSVGIATSGSHQPAYGGNGLSDGFFGKYKSDGTVEWSTYYGGGGNDGINAMALDGAGNIYIAGQAFSTTAIATNTGYQVTLSGSEDAFVAKFNNNGMRQWGTYYGGQYQDGAYGITLDGSGNVYITGETLSPTGISTAISHQHGFGGGANDAFIAQFNKDGTQLKWGTYYGGKSDDDGRSITYDGLTKTLYICGITKSDSSIATSKGYQPVYNMDGDGFIAAFTADSPYVFVDTAFADTVFCAGDSFLVKYTAVEMQLGNKLTIQLSDANGSFTAPKAVGSVFSLTSGVIPCRIPPGTPAGTGYRIRVTSSNPVLASDDNGIDIRIDRFPSIPDAVSNSPICEGDTMQLDIEDAPTGLLIGWSGPGTINGSIKNPFIENVQLSDSGDYFLDVEFGACALKDTVHVSVIPNPPLIPFTTNSPLCENQALVLTQYDTAASSLSYTYKWTGPGGFSDTAKNPQLPSVKVANAGTYMLQTIIGNCTTESIAVVEVNPTPGQPVITTNSPVNVGQELKLEASTPTPGVSYKWTGPDSFASAQQNINIAPVSSLHAGKYTVEVALGNCIASSFIIVNVTDKGNLFIGPNPTTGTFTISGSFKNEQDIPLRLVNSMGRIFYQTKVKTDKKLLNATITLPDFLPNGNYVIQLYADREYIGIPIVILK